MKKHKNTNMFVKNTNTGMPYLYYCITIIFFCNTVHPPLSLISNSQTDPSLPFWLSSCGLTSSCHPKQTKIKTKIIIFVCFNQWPARVLLTDGRAYVIPPVISDRIAKYKLQTQIQIWNTNAQVYMQTQRGIGTNEDYKYTNTT